MRSFISGLLIAALLVATAANADPRIATEYRDGVLRLVLDGSYAGAYYRVLRAGMVSGVYGPLFAQAALCTGDCFATDPDVAPGSTYFYRFDIDAANGSSVSYGPYAVSVPATPLSALISPNPSRGAVHVQLSAPGNRRTGAPLPAEASIVDVQGRTLRRLFSGALPSGTTALDWNGRDDANQALGPGLYFLRLTTPQGTSATRFVRVR